MFKGTATIRFNMIIITFGKKVIIIITSTMACTMSPLTVSLPKLVRLKIPFSRLALFKTVSNVQIGSQKMAM